MKNKIVLAFGTIILLLVSYCFSSYFALTALSRLYTKSLSIEDSSLLPKIVLAEDSIDIFINQQISIAILILLASSLLFLVIVAWRTPSALKQVGLNNIGWPLFLVNLLAQLLAIGLYINNFSIATPANMVITDLPDVIIEIITTLIIASLLFIELFILLLKLWQSTNISAHSQSSLIDSNSMRPVIFLFLFGVDLSAAFVPLHMKNLYQPLLDLPKDVVLGLPISAMFFSVSITIVLSGIWLDRRGWHEPFLAGLALTASAMLYAWLAPSAVHFIVAMGLVGLGYGLALMASQGFVIVHTDNKGKARGLAYLFAGMYAGSICGTAAGAMLAERIGYSPVFLLSGVMVFLTLGYTVVALRSAIQKIKPHGNTVVAQQAVTVVTATNYWNFLRNRYVLGLIFLSSLPSAIAVIGLLNYFGPVYLDGQGISQSIIGSVLILYSLCMVYLGPLLSKYIDASDNKRLFVFIGCTLGGCAFLSFHFLTGLVATIVAVLLLGVSSCFVLASQTTYALTLDVTQQLGQGRAIGIFRASSRIGQMLGPILFGWLMATTDINKGLTYFGIAYLTTAVLFILLTSERLLFNNKVICESSTASN